MRCPSRCGARPTGPPSLQQRARRRESCLGSGSARARDPAARSATWLVGYCARAMSQADAEGVRRLTAPYEAVDLVPFIRDYVERFGPDPDEDAVLAASAEDPSWRHFHPDIEWEASVPGLPSSVHGIRELAMWWGDRAGAWGCDEGRMLE